jgi:hypothetical protein
MTCLIDAIEDAFQDAAQRSEGEVVECAPVVQIIERYCKLDRDDDGTLEGIVDTAYIDARHAYGNEWRWQSGHVAELVCDGLRRYAWGEVD